MNFPAFLQLSLGDLRMPFSNEIKYTILSLAILLFLVAASILAWQIYRYCKQKPRANRKVTGLQSTDEKSAKESIVENIRDGGSDTHNLKVEKLQDEIEKLSRCLSPASSLSEQDSVDLDSMLEEEEQESPRGKLRFSLFYDRELSRLLVTVLGACELPARDFSQSVDPFVRVRVLAGPLSEQTGLHCTLHEWETRLVKKSRNPSFGDQFSCSLTEEEVPNITIKLEVRDFDKYSRHAALGEVRTSLTSSNIYYPVETLDDLQAVKKDLVGEVLLSLKYLPTSQRIEVGLLKIRTVSWTNNQDKALYARTSISCNQCRLKTQKTPQKSKQDVTVFNEIMTFSLPEPHIRECVIAVTVFETSTKRRKSKRLIGQAVVRKRKASEDEHWSLMMQCLRQPIAKWHSLLI
ncbi:synaptotagmin-2 [Lepisosteus oculatus]|uniref:synaptotagmin-2 n=1 Tax=Lepisosteus oculatus TaxID=7918 RepID=UPI0035F52430